MATIFDDDIDELQRQAALRYIGRCVGGVITVSPGIGRAARAGAARSGDDPGQTTFIRFGSAPDGTGRGPVISRAALSLYGSGIIESIAGQHGGFVGDDYLNAVGAATTIPALELSTAGLWHRVTGGYVAETGGLVELAHQLAVRQRAARQACAAAGCHEPSRQDRRVCGRCYEWLE
jgi:hypothetical protein